MISRQRGSKLISLLLLLATISSGLLSPAHCQQNNSDPDQKLIYIGWKGGAFSWQRQGSACWVSDSQGNHRFEVMVSEPTKSGDPLIPLLNWSGHQGWTLISTGETGGTFSRWHEQWQQLPSSLDIWLKLIVQVVDQVELPVENLPEGVREISPRGRTLPGFNFASSAKNQQVLRLQLPSLDFNNPSPSPMGIDFRHRLVQRGHGRGGAQTILKVVESAESPKVWKFYSTHQPGELILSQMHEFKVNYNPDEVFLPWWPLAGYLVLENEK